MEAPSSSDRTSNEISGASQVGGNAYQAKHMHFGGRSAGLTLVGLAAIGALTYLVVHAGSGAGGGQVPADSAHSPTVASASPSPSKSPSKSPSGTASTSADSKPKAEAPAAAPGEPKAAPKPATPSNPYSGQHLYCGSWRGSPSGSNLLASACTQVTGHDAAFGVMLKNVGKSQITVGMTVKYVHGTALDCPGGGYTSRGIRIDPGQTWYSDLGGCSVGSLNDGTSFQASAVALETSDAHASLNLGGTRYSPTAAFNSAGELRCKNGSSWSSCDDLWPYPPQQD